MKKYNIIENQIKELKLKGLKFKNEELAKKTLLKENYYFLTETYEEVFLKLKSSVYEDETYFEELYAIYNFDRELKNLVLDYIALVETKVKSFVAYEYTEKYGDVSIFKKENLAKNLKSVLMVDKLEKQVKDNIIKAAKFDNKLQTDLNQTDYLKPLNIVRYFMFRNIVSFYSIMKQEDMQKIAELFDESTYVLENQLKMLNVARNICAHSGVFFNFKYGTSSLYILMKNLKNLLDRKDFYNMYIRVVNLLIYVRDSIDELSYDNLLKMMEFPKDYRNLYRYEKKEGIIMNYEPKPVNTGDVILNEDILNLAEKLAKNTHDIWAIGRISEGWIYGTVRDDKLKTTPCLVEYEELPESEKEYDRNTAIETLKLIQKLGFKIIKEE